MRIFAGKFLFNAPNYYGNYNFRLSGNLGFQDFMYDNFLIARYSDIRNENSGLSSHQFIKNDGGFSLYTPYGQTNNWLIAINMESSLPFKFIKPYFSVAACPSLNSQKFADIFYESGISVNLYYFLCIYFPILASKQLIQTSNNFYTDNYFQKIRFTLSLEKLNLRKYRDNIFLFIK